MHEHPLLTHVHSKAMPTSGIGREAAQFRPPPGVPTKGDSGDTVTPSPSPDSSLEFRFEAYLRTMVNNPTEGVAALRRRWKVAGNIRDLCVALAEICGSVLREPSRWDEALAVPRDSKTP